MLSSLPLSTHGHGLAPRSCSHRFSLNIIKLFVKTLSLEFILRCHTIYPFPATFVFLLSDLGKNPSWDNQNVSQAFWAFSEIRNITEAKGRSVSGLAIPHALVVDSPTQPQPGRKWKCSEALNIFKIGLIYKGGLSNIFIQILLWYSVHVRLRNPRL